jgi:hypothetical protein
MIHLDGDTSPRAYPGSPYTAEAEIALVQRRLAELPDPTTDQHYEPVTDEERQSLIVKHRPKLSSNPQSAVGGNLFRAARDVAAEAPETVDWCLEGYLPLGAIVELVGKAKAAGKTTFVLSAVRAIVDGEPFLGRPTRSGPVVMLTEQSGSSLRAVLERTGLALRDDIRLMTWRESRHLSWATIVDEALAECRRIGAVLLIVDTLPQFANIAGDAENDAGAALAAIAPLQAACGEGMAVLVVRHERKGGGEVGESGRGSSAFTGAVDVVLRLAREPKQTRKGIRILSALSRFDETPDELYIELTDEGYIVLGEAATVALDAAKLAVVEALRLGDLPRTDLEAKAREASQASATTVQSAIGLLYDLGHITREGAGKRNDPFVYRLKGSVSFHQPKGWLEERNGASLDAVLEGTR